MSRGKMVSRQVIYFRQAALLIAEGIGIWSPQSYRFCGKELDSTSALNLYWFGSRLYDPLTARWTTQDPMSEKYYASSPYAYCQNDPVRFIDPDGRELRVAKEYQEQFRKDLQKVFGDRVDMLSFNDNGTLQLNGKTIDFTKGMTKDQKAAYNGLYKAINDKQVTSVVYADYYNVTVNNEVKSSDIVKEFGGGVYSKTDNIIVIAPNVGSVEVTLDQIQITADGLVFPTQNVQQNTTSTLFHEIGERNTSNINFRGAVIDFENYVRRIIGLPSRPYDINHSKTIKTNYTK
jgi:RHS repeat-associated protein